jgi:hypothetical protein
MASEISEMTVLDDIEKHLYIEFLPNKFRDEYIT